MKKINLNTRLLYVITQKVNLLFLLTACTQDYACVCVSNIKKTDTLISTVKTTNSSKIGYKKAVWTKRI
jgi:hypothetical protein